MKSFITLAFAAVVSAVESEDSFHFMQYISKYGKSYSSVQEYETRFENWLVKNKAINEHNALISSYKMAHNKFSDWSESEWASILTYREA